jgi:hypothetical protein
MGGFPGDNKTIDIKDVLDVTLGAIIWICSHFHADPSHSINCGCSS